MKSVKRPFCKWSCPCRPNGWIYREQSLFRRHVDVIHRSEPRESFVELTRNNTRDELEALYEAQPKAASKQQAVRGGATGRGRGRPPTSARFGRGAGKSHFGKKRGGRRGAIKREPITSDDDDDDDESESEKEGAQDAQHDSDSSCHYMTRQRSRAETRTDSALGQSSPYSRAPQCDVSVDKPPVDEEAAVTSAAIATVSSPLFGEACTFVDMARSDDTSCESGALTDDEAHSAIMEVEGCNDAKMNPDLVTVRAPSTLPSFDTTDDDTTTDHDTGADESEDAVSDKGAADLHRGDIVVTSSPGINWARILWESDSESDGCSGDEDGGSDRKNRAADDSGFIEDSKCGGDTYNDNDDDAASEIFDERGDVHTNNGNTSRRTHTDKDGRATPHDIIYADGRVFLNPLLLELPSHAYLLANNEAPLYGNALDESLRPLAMSESTCGDPYLPFTDTLSPITPRTAVELKQYLASSDLCTSALDIDMGWSPVRGAWPWPTFPPLFKQSAAEGVEPTIMGSRCAAAAPDDSHSVVCMGTQTPTTSPHARRV